LTVRVEFGRINKIHFGGFPREGRSSLLRDSEEYARHDKHAVFFVRSPEDNAECGTMNEDVFQGDGYEKYYFE
jgi:hypothetical protein